MRIVFRDFTWKVSKNVKVFVFAIIAGSFGPWGVWLSGADIFTRGPPALAALTAFGVIFFFGLMAGSIMFRDD